MNPNKCNFFLPVTYDLVNNYAFLTVLIDLDSDLTAEQQLVPIGYNLNYSSEILDEDIYNTVSVDINDLRTDEISAIKDEWLLSIPYFEISLGSYYNKAQPHFIKDLQITNVKYNKEAHSENTPLDVIEYMKENPNTLVNYFSSIGTIPDVNSTDSIFYSVIIDTVEGKKYAKFTLKYDLTNHYFQFTESDIYKVNSDGLLQNTNDMLNIQELSYISNSINYQVTLSLGLITLAFRKSAI